MINQDLNLTKFSDPYPGLKIENFFDDEVLFAIRKRLPNRESI